MEIAAIVGHTSPQIIMTSYSGFIKDHHLKIDINIGLFNANIEHGLGTVWAR